MPAYQVGTRLGVTTQAMGAKLVLSPQGNIIFMGGLAHMVEVVCLIDLPRVVMLLALRVILMAISMELMLVMVLTRWLVTEINNTVGNNRDKDKLFWVETEKGVFLGDTL